jgi:hypothetical protein
VSQSPGGPIGKEVQLTLTDSGSVFMTPKLGPSSEAVYGRLAADSAGQWILSMTGVRQRSGVDIDWKGERVAVPRVFVASASERRFSRARTAVFSTILTVALVAAREAFSGAGGATAPGGPPGTGGPK